MFDRSAKRLLHVYTSYSTYHALELYPVAKYLEVLVKEDFS